MSARKMIVLVAMVIATLLGWEAWRVLTPPPRLQQAPVVVAIPQQVGAFAIGSLLQEAGAIRSREGFVVLGLVRGRLRSLKAGEYEIGPGASTLDVLALLESGRGRRHAVLHPEGATVVELARALETAQLATAADVLKTARDPAFLEAHGITAPSAEGYLFPDTYHFVRGMRPQEMLGRMVRRLHAKWSEKLAERARSRKITLHELLTLASIIEREAVAREEQRLISAVFWNRLERGMLLQADPTVQYALGKGRQAVQHADLALDHPYNTYVHFGLPPGPIASPGLAAIEAALDPAPVDYLYFVKMDDRHHYFSTTVAEHYDAVARYRPQPTVEHSARVPVRFRFPRAP